MKKPASSRQPPKEKIEGPFSDADLLPARVAAMRDLILKACESGEIEMLRPAIERNETLPLFGKAGDRPKSFAVTIEFLRNRSFDGKGRETLLLLEAILNAPFAKVTRGQHIQYVWPAFAVIETPSDDETRLLRLRSTAFADLSAAGPFNTGLIHRVEIGEDGTWHAFGTS
jgi:hypothetical protein